MRHPIINIAELNYFDWGRGERFQARISRIGETVGAQKLGYSLTVLPPGKRAFPRHNHRINEEMFFIVEGEGEIQIGEARHAIRRGDVIACPPGGPDTAHQIVNTSKGELKYLAVSTKMSPEICEYPDSGKTGILAEFPTGTGGKPERMMFLQRAQSTFDDYWTGEE